MHLVWGGGPIVAWGQEQLVLTDGFDISPGGRLRACDVHYDGSDQVVLRYGEAGRKWRDMRWISKNLASKGGFSTSLLPGTVTDTNVETERHCNKGKVAIENVSTGTVPIAECNPFSGIGEVDGTNRR